MCLPRRCPSVVSMQCPQSPHFVVHSFTVDQGTCVFSYWGRDVWQLCHTSPSPITFHDANAFYWSNAFKTPYTSTGSLVVDLLSEYMVALTCIEKQHTHTDKFYVLFLNWSCQSHCSRRNLKSKECFFLFDFFYYNKIDSSSLKTKHNIYIYKGVFLFIWITFTGFIYIYILHKPSMGTVYTCHTKQYS